MSWPRGTSRRPERFVAMAQMLSAGLHQAEIARRLGVTPAAISIFRKRWTVTAAAETRRCLQCSATFPSVGAGNRICPQCSVANSEFAGCEFEVA